MTKLILAMVLLMNAVFAKAQPIGSGKSITQSYNYKNFDKLSFENLNGKVEVEIGKPWSVLVTVDDNLENLLSFFENSSENELKITFTGNKNNVMYIENPNLKIKITMPEASVIKNRGNSDLKVKNIVGRYFRLENIGNGETKISGTIDVLDIVETGNGNVDAGNLMTKKADLKSIGNGNIIANVSEELTGKIIGNGGIFNQGKAKFDANSKKIGNGNLVVN